MRGVDWNPDVAARLATMWADGLTCSQIAERLGVTKNAVVGKTRRMNLPRRRASTGNHVRHMPPARAGVPEFDPNRADKLLRRFSWEQVA